MNKYIFTGNLGKDAEVRATASGKVVCSFSVAVQDGYGDNEKTKWIKCSIFGKRAEGGLPQYLTTGTRVLVTGNPQAEAWIDKGTNDARGGLAVFVDDIELLSVEPKNALSVPKPAGQPAHTYQPPQPQGWFQQPPPAQGFHKPSGEPAPAPLNDFDDDITF